MTLTRRLGIGCIVLAIAMFLIGGYLFSYQGEALNPIIRNIGMLCFMLWLPTLIIGIVIVSNTKRKID